METKMLRTERIIEDEVSKEDVNEIKEKWNSYGLSEIKNSKLAEKTIRNCISKHGVEKIKLLTSRYFEIYFNDNYFFNYKYRPEDFYRTRTIEKFESDGSLQWPYTEWLKEEKEKLQRKQIQEQQKTFIEVESYQSVIDKLKTMPYDEYLNTEHWNHFRSEAVKFFSGKCVICGGKNHLSVHHKTYENRGRETFNDVILVCGDCHKMIHKIE